MRLPDMMPRVLWTCMLASACAFSQTTQGLISGRVVDSISGRPVTTATVRYEQVDLRISAAASADMFGHFTLPLLSPGRYSLRIEAPSYQALQLEEIELSVAGRLDFPIRLRPLNDVWEAGQYRSVFLPRTDTLLDFFGPDVDASRAGNFDPERGERARLETGQSAVISTELRDLPLVGRDVYTLLVTQPGVTVDAATGRGLGLSINGQRPSSSNFLLDGLENNNYTITGPLTPVAPEAVGEYRISTNNFSAEYGRTAGFVANAVSRSGGNEWHGLGYWYQRNDVLNANGFQQNANRISRRPLKEIQPGFSVGGPLLRDRLFVSAAFEYLRLRSAGDPFRYRIPTTRFVREKTAPGSLARRLLEQYGAAAESDDLVAYRESAPTSSIDRYLALPRVDYVTRGGTHRLMSRVALAQRDQPDFSWNPYEAFWMPLEQETTSVAATWTATVTPALTNELRAGWSRDVLGFDRADNRIDGSVIPTLSTAARIERFSFDPPQPGADFVTPIILPGGVGIPGFRNLYGYRNNSRNWELVENLLWAKGRHVWKFGGGWLHRRINAFIPLGRDAAVIFPSLEDFGRDAPFQLFTGISRTDLPVYRKPDDQREYRYQQFSLFAQDSFRASGRLMLNYGVRYERFGSPENTGATQDAFVQLGDGASFPERISRARLVTGSPGPLFDSDSNDLAIRAGLSYRVTQDGRTAFRAAYGIFHDRPFDNLWISLRANTAVVAAFQLANFFDVPPPLNYVADPISLISRFPSTNLNTSLPRPVLFQPGLRTPYAQSYYAGVTHQLSDSLVAELSASGSLGRKLITNDIINRPLSLPPSITADAQNPLRVLNPALPLLNYRANQGSSTYHAMSFVARYRSPRVLANVAYTWSKWIDNQSEPLYDDTSNLSFSAVGGAGAGAPSTFSRQFDSRADRGPSDFDQRHNLVFYSVWRLPSAKNRLLRDWQFAQLAAIRSGLPYTVYASPAALNFDGEFLLNNRADIVDPVRTAARTPTPGGRLILNRDAFGEPLAGKMGNGGRNAFRGPGIYSVDLSLSRFFPLPWLGEAGRLTLRADAFNVLNHANLNNPEARLDAQRPISLNFGEALFGRLGRGSNFPALTPLDETARQVQILLRVEF